MLIFIFEITLKHIQSWVLLRVKYGEKELFA